MLQPHTHEHHIERHLSDLVKKWWTTNPEAIRALEKFSRENHHVLTLSGEEKRKVLEALKLKNFKGIASGQRLDLSLYSGVIADLKAKALSQECPLSKKGVS